MSVFTAVPRWTLDPVPGAGQHEVRIPGALATALRAVASTQSVSFSAVLLTAHAKVLGALASEQDVCTGYAARGVTLPCAMTLSGRTWRDLLAAVAGAEAELMRARVPGADTPSFETVFEPEPRGGGELGEGIVLRVAFAEHDGLVLRVHYRTDVLDAGLAARIADYHITALALIAADPGAQHTWQSLLSAEELRFQLNCLAGRRSDLPDRRVHARFEERVRAHPRVIAALHGDQQWTYERLNCRANRLARALLARGLSREGVVAVVAERNLD